MTNKPMLSVQRELLEIYTGRKEGDWVEAAHELRTLLDKPSVEPEPYGWVQTAGKCINQITQEWDVVEGWTEKGYLWKALYTESPAQHQGEPAVAIGEDQSFAKWMHEVVEFTHSGGKVSKIQRRDIVGLSEEKWAFYAWKGRAKLAEQPAPVAVVMPELDFSFEHWWKTSGQYCRAGGGDYEKTFGYRAYEAALAEVARLNGVKP